jgi:hypothetical protein
MLVTFAGLVRFPRDTIPPPLRLHELGVNPAAVELVTFSGSHECLGADGKVFTSPICAIIIASYVALVSGELHEVMARLR